MSWDSVSCRIIETLETLIQTVKNFVRNSNYHKAKTYYNIKIQTILYSLTPKLLKRREHIKFPKLQKIKLYIYIYSIYFRKTYSNFVPTIKH
jgi:hypothetical protein